MKCPANLKVMTEARKTFSFTGFANAPALFQTACVFGNRKNYISDLFFRIALFKNSENQSHQFLIMLFLV